jgi:isoleucyl-tRNA synthetase
MAMQGAVKLALEQARSAGHVGSSLQSTVEVHLPKMAAQGGNHEAVLSVIERYAGELPTMFVVSGVRINERRDITSSSASTPLVIDFAFRQEFEVHGAKGYVEVRPPEHTKCSRCWRYVAPQEDSLCKRCEDVVEAFQG